MICTTSYNTQPYLLWLTRSDIGHGGIDMGRFEAGDERSRGSIHLDFAQIGQQLLRSVATRPEVEQFWMLVDEVPAIGR